MRKPRVYVCAPFTDDSIPQEKANRRAAKQDALLVARHGLIPRCPLTMFGLLTPKQMEFHDDIDISRKDIMRECFETLRICDAIYLHPGWQESKGCRREARLATHLGLAVLEGPEDLKEYADKFRPEGSSDA